MLRTYAENLKEIAWKVNAIFILGAVKIICFLNSMKSTMFAVPNSVIFFEI
jgi:hypothetical protein